MLIIFLFMYIFSFGIFQIPFLNSTYIVGVILIIWLIISDRYKNIFFSILLNKRVMLIFILLIIIICFSVFIPTMHLTYDYSILSTLINQLINLITGLLLFSLIVMRDKANKLFNYLIYIFIIQSIIQFGSFISPQINEIFNSFRSEGAIVRGQEGYGGIRGLGISGSAFFGLGIGFGLIYFYLIANWNNIFPKMKILKYISFALLLFGGFSAARTSMVGIIIGLAYLCVKYLLKGNKKIRKIIRFKPLHTGISIICLFIILIVVYKISSNEEIMAKVEFMKYFVFQFVYNYQSTGDFGTSSTDNLFNNMYFEVDESTLLIGDGLYTNHDNSYYGHTDAGYMRNLLYFGIGGLFLLFIYQLIFFDWKQKKILLFNTAIVIYILIVHIKGEALGFSILLQNILFMMFLYNFGKRNKILKINKSIS